MTEVSRRGDPIHPGSIAVIFLIVSGLVLTYWRRMPLTHSLILVNACTFIIAYIYPEMFRELGLIPETLLRGDRPHTLITSMYLHDGPVHLIFNMLFMLFIGMSLEDKIGTLRYGIIFYISGVAAGITFSLTTGLIQPELIAVGASGGLFGIMGAYARLYPNDRFAFFPFPYPLPIFTWAFIFLLIAIFGTFVKGVCLLDRVAHMAHVGGLLAGLALAPFVMKIPSKTVKESRKVDFGALERLAVSNEDRALLDKIKKEDEPEVRDAWIDHFLDRAPCPNCGRKLERKGRRVACSCGFDLRY